MAPPHLGVRDFEEHDLVRVAEIKIRNWSDTYAPFLPDDVLEPFLDHASQIDYMRAAAAAPGTVLLVAEDSVKGVIGFALTYLDRPPEPWLESLHVLADCRGMGAGTLLMRETARRIAQRGFSTMRLGVVEGNSKAEVFYERLGGISEGFEPADWAPGVRHHIYRWPDVTVLTGGLQ